MSVPERSTVIKDGERLHDVVPTDVSTLDLYGDSVAAPAIVRRIRGALHPSER